MLPQFESLPCNLLGRADFSFAPQSVKLSFALSMLHWGKIYSLVWYEMSVEEFIIGMWRPEPHLLTRCPISKCAMGWTRTSTFYRTVERRGRFWDFWQRAKRVSISACGKSDVVRVLKLTVRSSGEKPFLVLYISLFILHFFANTNLFRSGPNITKESTTNCTKKLPRFAIHKIGVLVHFFIRSLPCIFLRVDRQ